jgi:hypothetical protein
MPLRIATQLGNKVMTLKETRRCPVDESYQKAPERHRHRNPCEASSSDIIFRLVLSTYTKPQVAVLCKKGSKVLQPAGITARGRKGNFLRLHPIKTNIAVEQFFTASISDWRDAHSQLGLVYTIAL